MRTVPSHETRKRLERLLARARSRETQPALTAHEAINGLWAMRKRRTLNGLTIRKLIDGGRG